MDGGASTKQSGSLLNTLQPKGIFFDLGRIESDAPTTDFNSNGVILLCQFYEHFVAVAVATGVGEAILDDTVESVFQNRFQPVESDFAAEMKLRSSIRSALIHKVSYRSNDAQFIKDRWSDPGKQTSSLLQALLYDPDPSTVTLRSHLGILRFLLLENLEVHHCSRQLLGKPIVYFIGDQLPLFVVRLQQLLEGSLFILKLVVGLCQFRSPFFDTLFKLVMSISQSLFRLLVFRDIVGNSHAPNDACLFFNQGFHPNLVGSSKPGLFVGDRLPLQCTMVAGNGRKVLIVRPKELEERCSYNFVRFESQKRKPSPKK